MHNYGWVIAKGPGRGLNLNPGLQQQQERYRHSL
jgi:hypothetical protein